MKPENNISETPGVSDCRVRLRANSTKQERGLLIFSVMVAFMIGATCGIIIGSYMAYENAKATILMLNDEVIRLNNSQVMQGNTSVFLPEFCHRIYNDSSGGIYCDLQ